ncbi:hypothetical protein K474DRAFT_1615686 [Panus rudis PR-1116 ss-1]|nr:hypothetical protein K474DRAFT_1615686 [Panus rudis PR-1116 ss-1]
MTDAKYAPYTYVHDYQTVHNAAQILSKAPYLVLDSEGESLGTTGGALSVFCLGGSGKIFVFDALFLTDPSKKSIKSLLDLLVNPAIPKVMWDGRCDFMELFLSYGVHLQGVVDLQIAEITSRSLRGEKEFNRIGRLAGRSNGFSREILKKNRELFANIHVVSGMSDIVNKYQLGQGIAKDDVVVAMHRAGESSRWMERPLSHTLMQYAANDIFLIDAVFKFFAQSNYLPVPQIVNMSDRYVSLYNSRVQKDSETELGANRYVMMDALMDSPPGTPFFTCHRCTRVIPLSGFETSGGKVPAGGRKRSTSQKSATASSDDLGRRQRSKYCRLCSLCVTGTFLVPIFGLALDYITGPTLVTTHCR